MVLARCWYSACRFANVRILVACEVNHLNSSEFSNRITDDEFGGFQRIEQRLDVDVFVREYFGLDPKGPIFEPAFAIGKRP